MQTRVRNATDRREAMLTALRAEGFLSITDLTRRFDVSHMTVRRDLRHLEEDGQVRTVHGGASLSGPALHESGRWLGAGDDAEVGIGRCAAGLVERGDTIAVDAGRLGYEVARALPGDYRGTVVTHSIPTIQLLMSRPRPPRLVGLGGEVTPRISAFVGAGTVAAAQGLRVELLFLGVDALDDRGAYARDDAEAAVKRALIGVATRIVLVARHDSFTGSAPLRLGLLDRFHALVTDERPPSCVEQTLRRAGVRLLIAGAPGGQPNRPPGGQPNRPASGQPSRPAGGQMSRPVGGLASRPVSRPANGQVAR
ncbi:DeoR/GlpR family DNA-binding transcription regulator [Actinoplanes sp. URMC 104]|uniref:DeoR/GlpR family DNA-binding transcription regulator n=1 Tax=Actinoplanes sp. URMC 104 TaxID=3423409 RepID=UPI003F19CB49